MVVLNSCVWWCWLESPGIAFPVRNIFANLWEDTKEYPGSCDINIFKNMWWFWLTSNFWSWSWPLSLWPWANLSIINFPSFWLQWEMQDDASCPCGRTSESYHSMIRLGNFHDSYWNPMIFNHWWYISGKKIMGKSWKIMRKSWENRVHRPKMFPFWGDTAPCGHGRLWKSRRLRHRRCSTLDGEMVMVPYLWDFHWICWGKCCVFTVFFCGICMVLLFFLIAYVIVCLWYLYGMFSCIFMVFFNGIFIVCLMVLLMAF